MLQHTLLNWWRGTRNNAKRARRRANHRSLPSLEPLEDRVLLTTAHHLTFGQQPSSVFVGDTLEPEVIVEVRDQFHNVLTSATDEIRLAIEDNPTGGTLQGTSIVTAENGVATFDDLSIDRGGIGYTLAASAPSIALPVMGLWIKGQQGGEIAVLSYSWQEDTTESEDDRLTVGDFLLTVDTSTADAGFLAAVALNERFDTAVLRVRTPDAARLEYLTYTFTGVTFTSWQTGAVTGAAPQGTLRVDFDKVTQSQSTVLEKGELSDPVVAVLNADDDIGSGQLVFPESESVTQIGLTVHGVTGELPVLEYSWGEQHPLKFEVFGRPPDKIKTAGPLSIDDFTLTVDSSIADPGFLAAVARGQNFDSVQLHIRALGDNSVEVQRFTFTNTVFTSWRTDAANSAVPQGTLTLSFTKIKQEQWAVEQNDDEVRKVAAAEYDLVQGNGSGNLVLPQSNSINEIGLTLKDEGSVFEGELAVNSYFWKEDASFVGFKPGLGFEFGPMDIGSFILTVESSRADAGLLAAVALREEFDEATLHIRTSNEQRLEYLTYTFTNVVFTGWHTDAVAGQSIQGRLALDFAVLTQQVSPVLADGTLGDPVVAGLTSSRGSLRLPRHKGEGFDPGINFMVNDRFLPVKSFSWRESNDPALGPDPIVEEVQLTVDSSIADPAFMRETLGDRFFTSATLHFIKRDDNKNIEYLTYTFGNVLFTSWQTSASVGGAPENVLTFAFTKISQERASFTAEGGTGQKFRTDYDVFEKRGSGELVIPENETTPDIALSIAGVEGGDEVEVLGYAWGQQRDLGANKPDLGFFEVIVPSTIADPGFMLAVADGRVFEELQLHVRTPDNNRLEFLTYTFNDVVFTDWKTSALGTMMPVGTLTFTFNRIEQEERTVIDRRTLGEPVIAQYDVSLNNDEGKADLLFPAHSGPAPFSLSIQGVQGENGTAAELPVQLLSWGETNIPAEEGGSPNRPDISEVTLIVDPGIAAPGFLSAVALGTEFSQVKVHGRVPGNGQLEYLTYTFDDVVFTNWHTQSITGGDTVGNLSFVFGAIKHEYRPVLSGRELGTAVVAEYDTEAKTGSGDIVGPSRTTKIVSRPFTVTSNPPSAVDDKVKTNEDTAVTIAVLANDSDVDGDVLNVTQISNPAHGTAVLEADGKVTYTPDADYFGADSLTYTISDGTGGFDTATVNINVLPVNDAPSFVAGEDQTVTEDAGPQSVAGFATSISAGPANEANQSVKFLLTTNNDALFSSPPAIDAETGALTYTPARDANGTAIVTVMLLDNGGTANGGFDKSTLHTFVITVLSPTQQIIGMMDQVQVLDNLTGGQHNALTKKLEKVRTRLNSGKKKVALNKLRAFTNQVEDLLDKDIISKEEATGLLSAAAALRTSIEKDGACKRLCEKLKKRSGTFSRNGLKGASH